VEMLRERGVDDIVVNAHHFHGQIEEWVGGEAFYLANSDVVMENVPDVGKAYEKAASDEVIGCALVSEEGPRTVEVEPISGYITNWRSDEAGMEGTFTFCGLTVVGAKILDYIERGKASSIVTAFEKAMMEGHFIKTVRGEDLLWEDAGRIEKYIELNQDGEENAFEFIPQLAAVGAKKVKFIGARGSERVFFKSEKGIVVIYDDSKREENGLYAEQARWLRAKGVKVPEVIEERAEIKTLLISNGGSEHRMTLEEYVKVVEALERFNRLGAEKDLPRMMGQFDREMWKWERELFEEHCLRGMFGREMPKEVREELEKVAEALEAEPKGLVHRDFQSTNVLWKGGELTFIDFQGMRKGPAVYDLASLVYDPYAEFTEGERRALVALYAKKAGREEIVKVLPLAAVQRLTQCLGAYGRLRSVGQPQFMKYVLPALENLLDAADRAGLDAVGALAEDLIAAWNHAHEHGEGCKCGHHHEHGEGCKCGHHHENG